jgi:hypothetical protein
VVAQLLDAVLRRALPRLEAQVPVALLASLPSSNTAMLPGASLRTPAIAAKSEGT